MVSVLECEFNDAARWRLRIADQNLNPSLPENDWAARHHTSGEYLDLPGPGSTGTHLLAVLSNACYCRMVLLAEVADHVFHSFKGPRRRDVRVPFDPVGEIVARPHGLAHGDRIEVEFGCHVTVIAVQSFAQAVVEARAVFRYAYSGSSLGHWLQEL
jgi:hypothetical protein